MTSLIGAMPWRTGTRASSVRTMPLRRVRQIGYAVLVLELAGFMAWSAMMYGISAETFDFAQFSQAWLQIAHGHLNPYDSMQGFYFWQNNGEFLMWPLALAYWVWPHGVTLLWLQDIGIVAAQAVAFTWICGIARRNHPEKTGARLSGAGLTMLVANPWVWMSVSNDFHFESIAIPFAALLGWDLAHRRRRAWAWMAVLLLCGDVACTYVVGLGLGAALAYRRERLRGVIMACIGVGAILAIAMIHGNKGSGGGFQGFAYLAGPAAANGATPLGPLTLLKGVAVHPLTVLGVVFAKRADVLANLGSSGLVGFLFPPLLPILVIVMTVNVLYPGFLFAQPSFQTLPVYVLMPVGTVAVLSWLLRRRRRAGLVLGGLLLAGTAGWAAVWYPQIPGTWLRVPGPAADLLARTESRIPSSAEVVASGGVMGRFSNRIHLYGLMRPGDPVAIHGETWFVLAPGIGVEPQDTAPAMALMAELAGPLHATLMADAHGVWVFRWRPPPGTHMLREDIDAATLPAWTAPAVSGGIDRHIHAGPAARWHAAAARGQGYAASGLSWLKPPGRYQAAVTLSATGPASVEVWNDSGNILLARRIIPATDGIESLDLPVRFSRSYPNEYFSGWGAFRAYFVPPLPGNRLEVRVSKLGAGKVDVYRARLTRVAGISSAASSRGRDVSRGG
jgi:hypothetical protein